MDLDQSNDALMIQFFEALNSESGDAMRQLLQSVLNVTMKLEREKSLGAKLYERNEDLLLPWRTVLSNLPLGSELSSQEQKNARPEALKLLSRLGLAGYEEAYPHELSGGMKQRVSLATLAASASPLELVLHHVYHTPYEPGNFYKN